MSLAGVVILYNPEDQIIKNINTYIDYLDELYVIDNSDVVNSNIVDTLTQNKKVVYHKNSENMGISYSLNFTVKQAVNRHKWLLTMDQDSFFYKQEIKNYVEALSKFEDDDNIAGIAPVPVTEAAYKPTNHTEIEHVEKCITSGNIIKIKTALEVGGFDENLFIDQVDHEFCYRCNENGYKTYQIMNIKMIHHLGNPVEKRLLGFHRCRSANHNYIRIYYITRNMFYVMKKYPHIRKQEMKSWRRKIRKMLLAENDRLRKIRSIFEGYLDYRRNRFGKKYFTY